MRSILALCAVLALAAPARALPPGFTKQLVGGVWNQVVGVTFTSDGRMYAWEREGRVWSVSASGVKSAQPVLDISDEVGAWGDYGLLGVALHPNFLSNGYIYLLYVVDRHHLLHAGTPSYDPGANEYHDATIGRITRYRLEASSNFQTTDYGSRTVLLGESPSSGCPILHVSHGTGSLVFGVDGTLLASCGDVADFLDNDVGSSPETFFEQGLADGIITPKENVGALRSQLPDSLAGKILRLDPDSGDGVSSNPLYDPGAPRSARSRLWALGLRNPFRMELRPGTGSHDASEAKPGVLYVGDVGWDSREEIDVVDRPGLNFGWPLYEGVDAQSSYMALRRPNLDEPNPLYGQDVPGVGLCTKEHFDFQDLIHPATLEPTPSYPNPCDPAVQIPASARKWVHERPKLDWYHHPSGPARWTSWSGNSPVATLVGPAADPNGRVVPGPQFGGNTTVGGAWYTGTQLPPEYQNTFFFGDYASGWIRTLRADSSENLLEVSDFEPAAGGVVDIVMNPATGVLYYNEWTAFLWKVTWVGVGNQPPQAVASLDAPFGPGPHTVQFQGDASSDPENGALSYEWDFGDGSPVSVLANPVHVFEAQPGIPTSYTVTLSVRDPDLLTSQTTLLVSVNNTPPDVAITSPLDGTLYPVGGTNLSYPLTALISDAEQTSGLDCEWQVALHHNTHNHPEPVIHGCAPPEPAAITPVGCDGNTYFSRVTLTVRDAGGLATVRSSDLLPSCTSGAPIANPDALVIARGTGAVAQVLLNDFDTTSPIDPASIEIVEPPLHGELDLETLPGAIHYQHDGLAGESDSFSYRVRNQQGTLSNAATVSIHVVPLQALDVPALGGPGLAVLAALLAASALALRRAR